MEQYIFYNNLWDWLITHSILPTTDTIIYNIVVDPTIPIIDVFELTPNSITKNSVVITRSELTSTEQTVLLQNLQPHLSSYSSLRRYKLEEMKPQDLQQFLLSTLYTDIQIHAINWSSCFWVLYKIPTTP